LSPSTIHLTLSRRFEKGCGLAIALPTDAGDSSTVLARVTHVESLDAGLWLLVCTFVSELSDEEVQLVFNLDPHHHAMLRDAVVELTPVPPPPASIGSVLFQVLARSGGVYRWYIKNLVIAGQWPLPIGRIMSMDVPGAPNGEPIEFRVKNCRQFASYWIVDCKFLVDPPAQVLQLLAKPMTAQQPGQTSAN
jgi:hypothetical protein